MAQVRAKYSHSNPLTYALKPFHGDILTDILGLYYIDVSYKGGDIRLASSWAIYNELVATRPEVIQALAKEDWIHDTYVKRQPAICRYIDDFWIDLGTNLDSTTVLYCFMKTGRSFSTFPNGP